MIQIINTIAFDASKEAFCCKSRNGRSSEFFQYQGTMDGACGVYSLVMCLRILKLISERELNLVLYNSLESKNDLLNYLFAKRGMYAEGLTAKQIKTILKNKASINCTIVDEVEVDDLIDERVLNSLDNNRPCIIGVDWTKTSGHWMTCVGYEFKDYGEERLITKLLCLDPGSPESKVSPWNAFIELPLKEEGKLPHWYSGKNVSKCKLADAVIIG